MKERSDFLNNQAITFAGEGSFDEAIACFHRAILIDGENYLLWFNLGLTYRDTGDYVNAKSALEKALQLKPESEDTEEALAALCFNMHLVERAFVVCTEALEYNPSSARLWNMLGVLFFNEEKFEDASDAFETAVTINPFYADALFNLRDAYTELKNEKGAQICDARLKELEGDNA